MSNTGPGRKHACSPPPMGECVICSCHKRQYGSVYCQECEEYIQDLGWETPNDTVMVIKL